MMPYYLIKEKRIVDIREFLYVLLFPSIGLGYWTYNRLGRLYGPPDLPRRRHVWKKMHYVHIAYLVGFVLFAYIMILQSPSGGGDGSYTDFYLGMFAIVATLFMFVIFGLVFLIVALAMLLLPFYFVNSIKANHYQNRRHSTGR